MLRGRVTRTRRAEREARWATTHPRKLGAKPQDKQPSVRLYWARPHPMRPVADQQRARRPGATQGTQNDGAHCLQCVRRASSATAVGGDPVEEV